MMDLYDGILCSIRNVIGKKLTYGKKKYLSGRYNAIFNMIQNKT